MATTETEPARTLTVGFYDFPPAIYSDPQGQAQGPLVDLTRRVIEQAGYQASFRGLPSARLYAALQNGTIDLWPGAPGKPELQADTLEGRETLARINLNLYHRPDTPSPTVPDSLRKRGVIIIGGYNYWPQVNQMLRDPALEIRLHRTATHASALEMLKHRRADYLLDYEAPVNQTLARLGLGPLPYIQMHKVAIRFIVSRHMDDSQAVVDALDRAYAEMAAAGEDLDLPEQ
ncbi:bifunctional lytic transglycosylase/amino acid ABC transporter substrate-binding protein [Stutzerimonas zhaodongensis]|uniref:Bifunctional lytic transglycosylase/amino acid ABC transporter substrate-binding protein n=1 Tax=Stutzerimonas zhaodongensis TaxID=1176257 RepID=A0A3M2I0Q2_9GAMM|nr:transporter substrate-binding domain-containing protein [Stutzerimonas zhaodongensis]MCQ2030035.1 transporter substrate-binding domain-containing protein [Stutzerimonas zhaodongensis]MCQ4317026.1 transporter substrate-binding domain-containing protein [Stutzerimonas zhaodongensis]RMH91764.1 bifunctional lytic transglycosylase/amino acid ABC transporter substrate-binding protein [Stutzerimonas zhaodongensis]